MTIRTRKFVGTVLLLLFFAVYVLALMVVFSVLPLLHSNTLVEVLFYVIGGLLWVLPAAWLVRWMQMPEAAQNSDESS